MKKQATFLVLAALILQINGIAVSMLLFSANQQHIAQTCCERRVPGCSGKCFLEKNLEQGDQSRDTTPRVVVVIDASFDAIIESNEASILHPSHIRHHAQPVMILCTIHLRFPAPPPRFV